MARDAVELVKTGVRYRACQSNSGHTSEGRRGGLREIKPGDVVASAALVDKSSHETMLEVRADAGLSPRRRWWN